MDLKTRSAKEALILVARDGKTKIAKNTTRLRISIVQAKYYA